MEDMLAVLARGQALAAAREKAEVLACNAMTRRYGLALTDGEAEELLEGREEALRAAGRVEFAGGVLPRLIRAFCGSPYLEREGYAQTLGELQDVFYAWKSACGGAFSDDELIELMAEVFNGRAGGSADYLAAAEPEDLCRGGALWDGGDR